MKKLPALAAAAALVLSLAACAPAPAAAPAAATAATFTADWQDPTDSLSYCLYTPNELVDGTNYRLYCQRVKAVFDLAVADARKASLSQDELRQQILAAANLAIEAAKK